MNVLNRVRRYMGLRGEYTAETDFTLSGRLDISLVEAQRCLRILVSRNEVIKEAGNNISPRLSSIDLFYHSSRKLAERYKQEREALENLEPWE